MSEIRNSTSSGVMQPDFRQVDGLSIRYAESDGGHDDHVLLFGPWPESLFAYESIWTRLAQGAHLVAVDLPGFGQSERRDELLSPRAMGDFVIRLADAWGLDRPHVVAPDVGTGAALFAAALHPGRLRSLVVGSGGAAFPLEVTGALKDIIDAPDLEPFRAADPRAIVAGALQGIERHQLPDAVREDYLHSYEGDRLVESMQYVRHYPRDLAALRELLPELRTPVLIASGRRDAFVPPSNAEFLHERLPNSEIHILDTGHFVWEDAADEYAALLTAWWSGGYRQPGARSTISAGA
jgi:pimeloyl-ACP methyl ester carboxylesterase